MSLLVQDLVEIYTHGRFQSDVQLSSYWEPERNQALAKSFIFTTAQQGDVLGSTNLLDKLCESFLPTSVTNRIVIIGTYGHGKSHFAVAAANYFGQPTDSEAYRSIQEGLRHALPNDPLQQRFQSFREDRAPFLILQLRGDQPISLTSQLFRAVEAGLAQNPETAGIQPPFWFGEAEAFLERVKEDDSANAYLREFDTDVPSILIEVQQRNDDVFDQCRELFNHLYGVYPDFLGKSSLKETIHWIADDLCGDDKPFGGALILFDEFSTFVRNYAVSQTGHSGSPLQDLLNGLQDRRDKCKISFVAMAQHDPKTAVRDSGVSSTRVANISRELDRIDGKYFLKAVLEDVLHSYLRQDDRAWNGLLSDPGIRRQWKQASDLTWDLFSSRYVDDLAWDLGKFVTTVSEGCFPLHPITTALFSTVEFQQTAAPRSVLQFVFNSTENQLSKPAVIDEALNWIWPIELVDYFGEMLSLRHWENFQHAYQIAGADTTDEEERVLKALLLLTIQRIGTRAAGPDHVISELAGLARKQVNIALEDLEQRGVIRRDPVHGTYGFWPAGQTTHLVERRIRDLQSDYQLDWPSLARLNKELQSQSGRLQEIPVNVAWGSPNDWSAAQVLLTKEHLHDQLKDQARQVIKEPTNSGGPRGMVVWLIASDDDDVQYFRDSAADILNQTLRTLGNPSIPIVLMRPQQAKPELSRQLERLNVLSRFSSSDVGDVGEEQYRTVLDADWKRADKLLGELELSAVIVVPAVFANRSNVELAPNLQQKLAVLFSEAYRSNPREFFRQYRHTNPRLRTGVSHVASYMLQDGLRGRDLAELGNPVASQLVTDYLQKKWQILNPSHALISPRPGSPLHSGWQLLDEAVQRGERDQAIDEIVTQLLNAPYGYDPLTVVLLFTAWYGYHRGELQASLNGALVSAPDLLRQPQGTQFRAPHDALPDIARLRLIRTDPSDFEREVRALVDRVSAGDRFDQQDAADALEKLEQYEKDVATDPSEKIELGRITFRLGRDLDTARKYDEHVSRIQERIRQASKVQPMLLALSEIKSLPTLGIVAPRTDSVDNIRNKALVNLRSVTDDQCAYLENLQDIREYSERRNELNNLLAGLRREKLEALVIRVEDALKYLDLAAKQLQDEQQAQLFDETIRQRLAVLDERPESGLAVLRRDLEEISTLRPQSREIKEQLSAAQRRVEESIHRLEDLVNNFERQVAGARSAQEISEVRDRILQSKDRYAETSEGDDLARLFGYCDHIKSAFECVESITPATLSNPTEFDEARNQIQSVLERNGDSLSDQQKAVINRQREALDIERKARVQRASQWLQIIEQRLTGARDVEHLLDLRESIQHRPAFLSHETVSKLEAIENTVQERIAHDAEAQVIFLFKEISDPRRQRDLLSRLGQLVEAVRS